MLSPADRAELGERQRALLNGHDVLSAYDHRHQLWALKALLSNLPSLEASSDARNMRDAMRYLARALKWGFRVQHAAWDAYRGKVVLRAAVLLFKCSAVRLLTSHLPGEGEGGGGGGGGGGGTVPGARHEPRPPRNQKLECVSLRNKSGNVRTLFLMQYHLAMSHLVPQLKLVCPLDVMTEWEEMLWGPLRRNTVNTCNKARGTACVNALLRTQTRRRLKDSDPL